MDEVKVLSYYDNAIELEKEMNELLSAGWQLRGSLGVNTQATPMMEDRLVYTQVMFKPVEKIPKSMKMGAS